MSSTLLKTDNIKKYIFIQFDVTFSANLIEYNYYVEFTLLLPLVIPPLLFRALRGFGFTSLYLPIYPAKSEPFCSLTFSCTAMYFIVVTFASNITYKFARLAPRKKHVINFRNKTKRKKKGRRLQGEWLVGEGGYARLNSDVCVFLTRKCILCLEDFHSRLYVGGAWNMGAWENCGGEILQGQACILKHSRDFSLPRKEVIL